MNQNAGEGSPRPSDDEAVEATAAAWLAQRDDEFTPAHASEFAQWRAADVRHEAAVMRLEATWTALQQLRDFRPEAVRHPDRDLLRAPTRRRRVGPFPALAATAALAASLTLATAWWFTAAKKRVANAPHAYATTVGGYERVSLEDGSLVELNSASEVSVQFFPVERRVRLVRGEVYFTVAKNPARPFLVEAGAVVVRAVGTAFNVRLGARNVEVIVTEGRVAVAESDRQKFDVSSPRLDTGSGSSTVEFGVMRAELSVNERVVIPSVGATAITRTVTPPVIEKLSPEAVHEALAWQGLRLVFSDTPLADAIAQFNRRSPVQFVLADAELGALPIGGSFRAENVEAFVRLLASDNDIVVERAEPNRIVLRKARPLHRPN